MTTTGQALATQTTSTSSDSLPVVAHRGTLELLDASWDLKSGRTVRFRLVPDGEHPYHEHPFARFVARRGGKVGTRFRVAFARTGTEEVMFRGEVMLAGGGNPLGSGMWVKFWLDNEADEHPFSGSSPRSGQSPGDLFGAVFVELDDDDQAIDQERRDKAERKNGRGLAQYAGALCHNKLFAQYLSECVSVGEPGKLRTPEWWAQGEMIARWMRWTCGIESRSDLDRNEDAAHKFHEQIRKPYSAWADTRED